MPARNRPSHGAVLPAVLWLGSLATVIFLSLWPFTFDPALATPQAWADLTRSWGWRTHRGDAAGNVALFVPVGMLGMVALDQVEL